MRLDETLQCDKGVNGPTYLSLVDGVCLSRRATTTGSPVVFWRKAGPWNGWSVALAGTWKGIIQQGPHPQSCVGRILSCQPRLSIPSPHPGYWNEQLLDPLVAMRAHEVRV